MKPGILVFIEQRTGQIRAAAIEALAEALRQKAALGGPVHAVIVGHGLDTAVDCLTKSGADQVHVYEDASLAHYAPEAWRAALVHAAKASDAGTILLAATVQGREVAAGLAGALEAGYAADATGLEIAAGALCVHRPVYAGKALLKVKAVGVPFVISLRPNVFSAQLPAGGGDAAVHKHTPPLLGSAARVRVTALNAEAQGKKDVSEAEIVVSGGRGTGGPEGFKPLEDLAAALGAAVGASRAVVDLGWRPHSEQVGQTGKVVSPKLYIAAGVSGAIQHLAGMRTSKVIVAINKDAEAPIFKVADYGIVGDLHEILPALTAAVQAHKASR